MNHTIYIVDYFKCPKSMNVYVYVYFYAFVYLNVQRTYPRR